MKSNHAEAMKLIVHHQENPMEHQLDCLLPPTWEWEVTLMMAIKRKSPLAKLQTGVHGVLVARNVDQVFREGQECISFLSSLTDLVMSDCMTNRIVMELPLIVTTMDTSETLILPWMSMRNQPNMSLKITTNKKSAETCLSWTTMMTLQLKTSVLLRWM